MSARRVTGVYVLKMLVIIPALAGLLFVGFFRLAAFAAGADLGPLFSTVVALLGGVVAVVVFIAGCMVLNEEWGKREGPR